MTDIHALLDQLHWPEQAKNDRGANTWTVNPGNYQSSHATGAIVMVGHAAISARLRLEQSECEQCPARNLDIAWSLSGDQATLVRFIKDGQEQPLDEAAAVALFQQALDSLGVQPSMQLLTARNTPPAIDQ